MIVWTPAKKIVAAFAALGVGALVVHVQNKYREHNLAADLAGVVLDPDLDSLTRAAVLAALAREDDVGLLHEFASLLEAAGFHMSARHISMKASHVFAGCG